MRKTSPFFALLLWPMLWHGAVAGPDQEPEAEPAPDTVLLSRGDAAITVADYRAALSRIPEEYRRQAASDPEVARKLLGQLLENRLLAREARASGVAERPEVRRVIRLETEKLLARRQYAHVLEARDTADLDQMAREYWLANQDRFRKPASLSVQHVLIEAEERSEDRALELAREVYRLAQSNERPFDELVAEYSEDPRAATNDGYYRNMPADRFEAAFADAALALEPGGISEPVRTPYGYHVIRLIESTPEQRRPFDAVRDEALDEVRKRHENRMRELYLNELLEDNPLEVNEEGLRALFQRHDLGPAGEHAAGDSQ